MITLWEMIVLPDCSPTTLEIFVFLSKERSSFTGHSHLLFHTHSLQNTQGPKFPKAPFV